MTFEAKLVILEILMAARERTLCQRKPYTILTRIFDEYFLDFCGVTWVDLEKCLLGPRQSQI